jgi:hypothetical protein
MLLLLQISGEGCFYQGMQRWAFCPLANSLLWVLLGAYYGIVCLAGTPGKVLLLCHSGVLLLLRLRGVEIHHWHLWHFSNPLLVMPTVPPLLLLFAGARILPVVLC